jgi:hypothetical protein
MLNLLYVLHLGPAAWPVDAVTAYAMVYELMAECAALYGYIVAGMVRARLR